MSSNTKTQINTVSTQQSGIKTIRANSSVKWLTSLNFFLPDSKLVVHQPILFNSVAETDKFVSHPHDTSQ